MKKIIAKQEACMGCGICEVYCTAAHSKSKDIVKAYNSEKPKTPHALPLVYQALCKKTRKQAKSLTTKKNA